MEDLADSFPVVGRMLVVLINIYLWLPLLSLLPARELCRKHAISDATFYTWRKKYGGMEVPEVKRLKSLEEENARLKKLLAEAMLDKEALQVALGRKY